MPPKKKDTVVLLVNVGSTSGDQISMEDEPFLDKAKYAMRCIIEKRLFLKPTDEIGIITMGDDQTQNRAGVDHIKEYAPLKVPNWDMLHYVNELKNTDHATNWIEGVFVALQYIQEEIQDSGASAFLILLHNFKDNDSDIEQYDPSLIIEELAKLNLHVMFLGDEPLFDKPEETLNCSQRVVLGMCQSNLGQFETLNDFIRDKRFYLQPTPKPMPWKCDLDWDGIKIPCSSYVKISETSKLPSWNRKVIEKSTSALTQKSEQSKAILESTNEIPTSFLDQRSEREYAINKKSALINKERVQVEIDDAIRGYKFGGKFIPFTVDDEEEMKFTGSETSLKIYGFVDRDKVTIDNWSGSGSRIVVPQSEELSTAFYTLVKGMDEKNYAAIVRKVYRNNTLPTMGVLFPRISEDDVWCFVHLEIPFTEDKKSIPKDSVRSVDNILSTEQSQALDGFIDAMTDDSEDTYTPGMLPDAEKQYFWNILSHRALNPTAPILPENDYLKKMFEIPENLKNNAASHVANINKLFDLVEETATNKKKNKNAVDALKTNSTDEDQPIDIPIDDNSEKPATEEIECFDMDEIDEL